MLEEIETTTMSEVFRELYANYGIAVRGSVATDSLQPDVRTDERTAASPPARV